MYCHESLTMYMYILAEVNWIFYKQLSDEFWRAHSRLDDTSTHCAPEFPLPCLFHKRHTTSVYLGILFSSSVKDACNSDTIGTTGICGRLVILYSFLCSNLRDTHLYVCGGNMAYPQYHVFSWETCIGGGHTSYSNTSWGVFTPGCESWKHCGWEWAIGVCIQIETATICVFASQLCRVCMCYIFDIQ